MPIDHDATPGSSKPQTSDDAPPETSGRTDPKLLELLVCPLTKTSLDYDARRQELISRAARLAFPIRDGVPVMTVDAARHLDDDHK